MLSLHLLQNGTKASGKERRYVTLKEMLLRSLFETPSKYPNKSCIFRNILHRIDFVNRLERLYFRALQHSCKQTSVRNAAVGVVHAPAETVMLYALDGGIASYRNKR